MNGQVHVGLTIIVFSCLLSLIVVLAIRQGMTFNNVDHSQLNIKHSQQQFDATSRRAGRKCGVLIAITNEGTYRSGEGGGRPAICPRI